MIPSQGTKILHVVQLKKEKREGNSSLGQVLSGREGTDWREERVTVYLLPISDGADQSTQLNLEHVKKKKVINIHSSRK